MWDENVTTIANYVNMVTVVMSFLIWSVPGQ